MSKLYIFKASAGSGKTHLLTKQYLGILFKNPNAYRNILAVTFTNKAAGEMKRRIIHELSSLSADKAGSIDKLCKTLNLKPEIIIEQAGQILDLILNDFSKFSIGTIDSFFQLIIRAFTIETNLQGSYKLELKNNEILAEATDNLLYELNDNENLRQWLTRYAEVIMKEGYSLDLNRKIIELGQELFNEKFKNLGKGNKSFLPDSSKIRKYNDLIGNIDVSFRREMKEFGKSFLKTCSQYNLEFSDFKNKSRSFANYFNKIKNQSTTDWFVLSKTVTNAVDNCDEWYSEASGKKEMIRKAYEGGLNEILKDTISFVNDNLKEYLTAVAIGKFSYAFGILFDLSKQIRQILKERNLFLISDSAQFLNEIIGQNDAPFIYEKAGIYYKYFMLDEFQDTSAFQWMNFKPLLSNSLAQGFDNMVVGDVKQSIYRWRNAEWNILDAEIENAFSGYFENQTLKENWRSRENIIYFNNLIFDECPHIASREFLAAVPEGESLKQEMIPLSEKISSVYKNSEQVLPKGLNREGGYVRAMFLPGGMRKKEVLEEIRKQLPEVICSLQDRGYKAGDIGILVRYGKEGKKIASALLDFKKHTAHESDQYNFNVISNDSLYINNNSAVKFLVALLRQIKDKENNLNEAFLIHEYMRYIKKETYEDEDPHFIFEQSLRKKSKYFNQILSEFQQNLEDKLHLSLYELVENITDTFHLNENPEDFPFIQAFQDIILSFMQNESSDISSFIKYWDEAGDKETLNISEKQDAITIMTIHKAKGLEFKVVIIPFCDWYIDHEQRNITNILWCKTDKKPFDFLPFVPVRYSPGLSDTYFAHDYQIERLHAFVDNLNLLYVAFTRTKEELYIWSSPSDKEHRKINHVGDILINALDKLYDNKKLHLKKTVDNQNLLFELGEQSFSVFHEERQKDSKVFEFYPVNTSMENLKIRYKGDEYFSDDWKKPGSIEYGVIMHEILSRIRYRKDLDSSVEKSVVEGKIEASEKEKIIEIINEGFSKSLPQEMFEPGWKIYTEREILTPEGNYRPDRMMFKNSSVVIIDYKFGNEVRDEYSRQVSNYAQWIKRAGYGYIKGYVWYFTLGILDIVVDSQ